MVLKKVAERNTISTKPRHLINAFFVTQSRLKVFDTWRRLAIILDYEFGRGVSKALPKKGLELVYSRRSERIRQIMLRDELFATIRPNGAVALTVFGAGVLAANKAFLENSVVVEDEAVPFVKNGKSTFCKFVVSAGKHVLPGGEVVILDRKGNTIGVGRAKIHGKFMREFRSGIAVKVRTSIA